MVESYTELKDKQSYLKFEMNRTQRELDGWSDKGSGEEILEKRFELGNKVEAITKELNQIDVNLKELDNIINSFTGLDYDILYLKYHKGLKLSDVAAELNYSYQYIKNKHAEIKRKYTYHLERRPD